MAAHVLLIDNYDSFTYNLAQAFGALGARVTVRRNDAIGLEQARRLRPTHLVISPGPGTPRDAGISNLLIRDFAGRVPILGVCLGHQCIAHVFGGRIVRARTPMHGKVSRVFHDERAIFRGVPNPLEAARYHSLVVQEERLPKVLDISAHTSDGVVMGVRHREYPIEGVQFHPESVATRDGLRILRNFLAAA
jgi:anthranilate synthase/aminodeoxychorismate synthase-like glutamine amidotransferase